MVISKMKEAGTVLNRAVRHCDGRNNFNRGSGLMSKLYEIWYGFNIFRIILQMDIWWKVKDVFVIK